MKVLSTTTTMSLLYSWTNSEQAFMSTTFIVGLVGVSIHTSYTKKQRVSKQIAGSGNNVAKMCHLGAERQLTCRVKDTH